MQIRSFLAVHMSNLQLKPALLVYYLNLEINAIKRYKANVMATPSIALIAFCGKLISFISILTVASRS